MVLARPRVAEFLEATLRESPGVGVVRANPVTGRLLIFHGMELSSAEVGRLVRAAVALAAPRADALPAPLRNGHHQVRPPQRGGRWVIVGGATAIALVVGKSVSLSPLLGLGSVFAATVLVVRRALRRSDLSDHASTVSRRLSQHPLLHIVGPHRRKLYLASILSVVVQALDMAPNVLIGWMFVLLTTGASPLLARLGVATVAGQIWFLTGLTALVSVLTAGVAFVSRVLWRDLSQVVQQEWRVNTYAHVQRAGLRYLEGERTTRIAGVLTDDINQLGRFFDSTADYALKLGSSFLVLVPLFLFFAPSIAWVAFLPVPLITWLSLSHQERMAPNYVISGEQGSLLNSQLINNLEASATVKSFCAEEYEIDHIRRLSEMYRESNRRINVQTSAYIPMVRVCSMVSFAGILGLGGMDVLSGGLSFAAFSILIGGPQMVLWKLPEFGDAADQYQRTLAALGRVLDLQNLPVESDMIGRRLDTAAIDGEMVLDRVTFGYPGRPPVLQNLSLRIPARKTTGIVGVTGAGKTTIAKLLLRFHDVLSGRVLFDGVDVREIRLYDLRRSIGFVAQDAFLFDGTIGDNIRYGSFDADPQQVKSAARLTKADGFVEALPAQYDTMIGERGITLSGGQKQRLSLARAIVKDAPIVILDEATSAVDNETEAAIQRALSDFAQDRTMVIIAHRLSTIRHADWIYVLGPGGVVAEEGTHHQLLEHGGVYSSLWRLQIGETGT